MVGWVRQYPTSTDFDKHVLSSFGLDPKSYDPQGTPEQVNRAIASLREQYLADRTASDVRERRDETLLKAQNRELRKTISSNQVWKETELSRWLDRGTLQQDIQNNHEGVRADLYRLVEEETVGFSDGVPDGLLQWLENNASSPASFLVSEAVWAHHNAINSPQTFSKVSGNKNLEMSFYVGLAFDTLSRQKIEPEALQTRISQMVLHLQQSRESPLSFDKQADGSKTTDPKYEATVKAAKDFFQRGEISGRGWFGDNTKTLLETMNPYDRFLLTAEGTIGLALGEADPVSFAFKALESKGYIPLVKADGKLELVKNTVDNGYPTIPSRVDRASPQWRQYENDLMDRMSKELGVKIVSISPTFYEIDLEQGRMSVTATTSGGQTIQRPAGEFWLGGEDWHKYKTANPVGPAVEVQGTGRGRAAAQAVVTRADPAPTKPPTKINPKDIHFVPDISNSQTPIQRLLGMGPSN